MNTFVDDLKFEVNSLIDKRLSELYTFLNKKGVEKSLLDQAFGKVSLSEPKKSLEKVVVKKTQTLLAPVSSNEEFTLAKLNKLLKKDIEEICKAKGIKYASKDTKGKLIEMLINSTKPCSSNDDLEEIKSDDLDELMTSKKITSRKNVETSVSKLKKPVEKEVKVIKKIEDVKPSFSIRKNKHGNMELPELGLVFEINGNTKVVIGRQSDNSDTIIPLSVEDIETCKQYKFDYKLPFNLSTNSNSDEKVEELEELEETSVETEDINEQELIEADDIEEIVDEEDEEEIDLS